MATFRFNPHHSLRFFKSLALTLCVLGALSLLPAFAGAQEAAPPAAPPAAAAPVAAPEAAAWAPDTGDTAWVLASAALVLLMTPGLAFFYGGMVRSKNMLNTLLLSFAAMGVMTVVWIVAGYSLAFGDGGGMNAYIGSLQYLGLAGVDVTSASSLAKTIPHQAFMVFQGMFFIITPALISGSLVERVKFNTFLVFMALWGLLVYCPVAHWVWGGGWAFTMGALDFAGGAVVHVNAGFAALAGVLALGPRREYRRIPLRPHNLPFTLLGTGLLWFGWFGFNAGSALGSGTLSTVAFVNTNIGAAGAMLMWMILDQVTRKEMTALGAATGAVAGLVGITPACGFVSPMGALAVGAITSLVCFFSANWRAKSNLDDSLDAFAVHGVGGFTGALLTGIFCTLALKTSGVNSISAAGLLEGNVGQVWVQFLVTAITAAYSFIVSFILMKVLGAVMGLRVDEEVEQRGLDIALHGEEAYAEVGA